MNIKEVLENIKHGKEYIQALERLQSEPTTTNAAQAETLREITKTEREQKEFEKVLEFLGAIDERYEKILNMHINEGKTFVQIAEIMQYDDRHIYRIYKKAIQAAEMAYKATTAPNVEE